MSEIFNAILREVCSGRIEMRFRVEDVREVLGPSTSFLANHCIDETRKHPLKNPAFFIRIEEGLFRINPSFYKCQ